MKLFSRSLSRLKSFGHTSLTRTRNLLEKSPLASFLGFLVLLFVLVVAGNFLRKPPEPVAEAEAPAAQVQVFSQDGQPSLELTARIEKDGVITVLAQSPGIVNKIHVTEGKQVKNNERLVSLSTTYQGGTLQTAARQLVERNTKFNRETYDLNKEIIGKQRDLANKGETQARELREISRKSIDDTKGVISLNEEIIRGIDANIAELEATNVGGVNDDLILAAKQGKAQFAGPLANLRAALRSTEYQSSDDNTPAKTAEAARDLALKQLDLQEKSLDLSRDVSELNLKIARITEQLMYPAAPCGGTVERVYVKEGDSVNPGTPIATIRTDYIQADAVVAVPGDIARQVNQLEPSIFILNNKEVTVFPRYVSREATEGSLFSIFYTLPENMEDSVTQGSTVTVRVPIGNKKVKTAEVIAPIDSIYQTTDRAYLYVVKSATPSAEAGQSGQVAELREVDLGQITGEYVQVLSGLDSSDQVITSRGITNGQKVIVK